MKKNKLFIGVFIFFIIGFSFNSQAQEIDLLLKGGHVIDPKNGIDSRMDVAIKNRKIVEIAPNIAASSSKRVVDVSGLFVVPGLIDMHAHHFPGASDYRFGDPIPDGFTFRTGVTTSIDAGSSGWKSFQSFKEQIIDRSQTRILAWLNIVGEGYLGRETYEQDLNDMDSKLTAITAKLYKDYIVGVKVAHYKGPEFTPVDRAVEAGNLSNIPVMVDFGEHNPTLSIEKLFMEHLRPGDVFTHAYAYGPNNREVVVDESKKVKPFVFEAQKRGIIFDVGHGGGAFSWNQAIPSIEQGFKPNTISTDFNKNSTNGAMKDLLNVMSKLLAIGLDFNEIIEAVTWAPAQVIQREDLGSLSVGSEADIAVLNIRSGDFGFMDVRSTKVKATQKLEAELTIRAGRIVWDLNGISVPVFVE